MRALAVVARAIGYPSLVAPSARWATRAEWLVVVGYLFVLAVCVMRMSVPLLFWFDEFFTLYLARSPLSLGSNLAAGVDLNPPLSYLITWLFVQCLGEVEWAVRLPSLLGALLGCACLYAFVRRRRGISEGLLALTIVGLTSPVWIYFLEARPYGLMIGFTALAMMCWQRATEAEAHRGWRIGFGVALALGLLTHYYFVVPIAGIFLAEVVRSLYQRRIDRGLLLGFVCAGLLLMALQPLWGSASKSYATGFWSKVKFTRDAIDTTTQALIGKDVLLPACFALAIAAIAGARKKREAETAYPIWEVVALVAIASGPVIGVAVGAKLTGGFYYRYIVPSILGLAGLAALAIGRTAGGSNWACLVVAIGCAISGATGHWRDVPNHFRMETRGVTETIDFFDANVKGGTIIVELPFEFTRYWHYYREKPYAFAFLADTEKAFQYTKSDTVDRGIQSLAHVAAMPVMSIAEIERLPFEKQETYYFGTLSSWRYAELKLRNIHFDAVATRQGTTLYRLSRRQ